MLVKILAETQREKNGAYKRHKKTALNQWTDKEPRKRRLKTTQKTALNSGPGEYCANRHQTRLYLNRRGPINVARFGPPKDVYHVI